MAYDYVQRTYGVKPVVGGRVRHTVTGRHGTVTEEAKSQAHYVQVRFDGKKLSDPCHPTELDYSMVTDEMIQAACVAGYGVGTDKDSNLYKLMRRALTAALDLRKS